MPEKQVIFFVRPKEEILEASKFIVGRSCQLSIIFDNNICH